MSYHEPVLLDELLEQLELKEGARVLDCTLGGGGHAYAVAQRIGPAGRLIALDVDVNALEAGGARLRGLPQVELVRKNFGELEVGELGQFDAAYMDLGVSSAQFDVAERGFSFRFDAPLDMRMDDRLRTSAADLVNELEFHELRHIIRQYGEEPQAHKIAAKIVENRPIKSTAQLARLIEDNLGRNPKQKIHPATRTFQALRIAVNKELDVLQSGLGAVFHSLNPAGRMAVISYHSLEDRIVKEFFRSLEGRCVCPRELPVCLCNPVRKAKVVGKPIMAGAAEVERNPRARSAKMRVAERVMQS